MNVVPLACRLWRVVATATTIAALAGGAAYLLGLASAGNGPILVVEGPPINPTTRINLGEPIRYGLRWHYIEGGCESFVVAVFTKPEGKEETQLYQRRRGRPRAVGQPGFDPIERPLPGGITAGRWHYKTTIESQCLTRKPPDVPFAEFDIEVVDPAAPVTTVQALAVTTPVVQQGGKLGYRISFTRRLSGSGVSIATYLADPPSNVPGTPDVVTAQRPIGYSAPGAYTDVDVLQPLPPELWPGRWRVRLTTLQNLPEGKQQFDALGELSFEVRP